jgi:uncharacterized protein YjcR
VNHRITSLYAVEPAYTLNKWKRPEGWKPHHETLRMVNDKIENGSVRLKQMVERIRKAAYNNNSTEKSKGKATNQEDNTMQSSPLFQAMKRINLNPCQI